MQIQFFIYSFFFIQNCPFYLFFFLLFVLGHSACRFSYFILFSVFCSLVFHTKVAVWPKIKLTKIIIMMPKIMTLEYELNSTLHFSKNSVPPHYSTYIITINKYSQRHNLSIIGKNIFISKYNF